MFCKIEGWKELELFSKHCLIKNKKLRQKNSDFSFQIICDLFVVLKAGEDRSGL